MSEIVTVYAVFDTQDEAETIARAMVEQRLAACVNILAPCKSIYRWQGAIAVDAEVPALFKTSAALADKLVTAIGAAHSYDVPAICVWPIANTPEEYARWVAAETDSVS